MRHLLANLAIFNLVLAGALAALAGEASFFFATDPEPRQMTIDGGRLKVEFAIEPLELPAAISVILSDEGEDHEVDGRFHVQANFDKKSMPASPPAMSLGGRVVMDGISLSRNEHSQLADSMHYATDDPGLARAVWAMWVELLEPREALDYPASGKPPVTYLRELAPFLAALDRLIRQEDLGSLADAMPEGDAPRETRVRSLEQLRGALGDRTLAQIYSGEEFPADKDRFKLGGHDSAIGHTHIDFTRRHGLWRLERIWQCR